MKTQSSPGPERRQGRGDTVIVYHAIGSVPRDAPEFNGFVRPDRFQAQMAYLAHRRQVIPLDALLSRPARTGPPRVAITFDDGYCSALEHAVPVLRAHGFPATFFVPTKWIGTANAWDPGTDLMRELMSFAQVDHNKLGAQAKAAIGELTNELQIISVEEKEPQTNRNGKSAELNHVQRSDAE